MDGPRVLVVEPAANDPVGRLGQWLTAAGLHLDVRTGDDLPADLDGYAGLVVTGGMMGAYDDAAHPFLTDLKALLRAAITDEVPTLAVCLGAQLLAAATGGQVIENPEGPEIGAQLVAKRSAAAGDPLFRSLPILPDVIQWHYDHVSRLPAGAVHLASSPVCENQAFRVGRLAWGLQFHIETTPEVVADWARTDAQRLVDWDLDAVVERAAAAHDDIAETWEPFAAGFADVVRDPASVQPAGGPAVTTAGPVTDPAAIRAALAAEANNARGVPGAHGARGVPGAHGAPGSTSLGMPGVPPRN